MTDNEHYALAPNPEHARLLVRTFRGCHHGRLWAEYCVECEKVGLRESIAIAQRGIANAERRLAELERDEE